MRETYRAGKWSLLQNEEYWKKEYDVTFIGPKYWAVKENGVKVTIQFFSVLDAFCEFIYTARTFSIRYVAYPIVVYSSKWLEINRRYIDQHLKDIETKIRFHETDLLGSIDYAQLSELLSDVQDSNLYDCLFDGPAEYWPQGHKAGAKFDRLVRQVRDFNLDDSQSVPTGVESQIDALRRRVKD